MNQSIIDTQPYGRFHRKLFLLSSAGPFLDGYILSVIGAANTGATDELGLTSFDAGLVGAAALIGVLIGGLVFGPVTDRAPCGSSPESRSAPTIPSPPPCSPNGCPRSGAAA